MHGLTFHRSIPLTQRFGPVIDLLDPLSWIGDFYTGPYVLDWLIDNDELIDEFEIENEFDYLIWKTNTFSQIYDHIIFDEQTLLIGFNAGNEETLEIAEKLHTLDSTPEGPSDGSTRDFYLLNRQALDFVKKNAEVFIFDGGPLEVYGSKKLIDRLSERDKSAVSRNLEQLPPTVKKY